jgi:hypothetical protein
VLATHDAIREQLHQLILPNCLQVQVASSFGTADAPSLAFVSWPKTKGPTSRRGIHGRPAFRIGPITSLCGICSSLELS